MLILNSQCEEGARDGIDIWYMAHIIWGLQVKTLLGSDIKWTSKIMKNIPRIIDTDVSNGDATNFSIVNLFNGSRTLSFIRS